jgi:hypothetical protein
LRALSEVFLGQTFDLIGWKEAKALTQTSHADELSQPLIPGICSLQYKCFVCYRQFLLQAKTQGPDFFLKGVQCDYLVIGQQQNAADNLLNRAADTDLSTRLSDLMLELERRSVEEFGSKQGQTRCLAYCAIYNVQIQYQQEAT